MWLWLALVILISGCVFARVPTTEPATATGTPVAATPTPEPTASSPATTGAPATATPTTPATRVTPTASPSATPPAATATQPPSGQAAGQLITLELPVQGQSVGNPLRVRGRTRQMPFEGTLVIRVYDAQGQLAAEVPIIAQGDFGGPATFDVQIPYGGVPGAGRVEVLEFSAMDGSIVARAGADITLTGFPGGGYIELPEPLSNVTLPIRLLARVGRPGQQVNVTVAWNDAAGSAETSFTRRFTTLAGLDGRGLLIVPLDADDPGFAHPDTWTGRIEIHTLEGSPLAYQPLTLLHPNDPDTLPIEVTWTRDEALASQTLRIPRTQSVARAALEALIWGPVPQNRQGFSTQLPTPEQVLTYPGRDASWGERIQIRSLTIENGVAHADFSLELGAYSGGALQSVLMREQIETTLLQFATVDEVIITVNGVPAILEP